MFGRRYSVGHVLSALCLISLAAALARLNWPLAAVWFVGAIFGGVLSGKMSGWFIGGFFAIVGTYIGAIFANVVFGGAKIENSSEIPIMNYFLEIVGTVLGGIVGGLVARRPWGLHRRKGRGSDGNGKRIREETG